MTCFFNGMQFMRETADSVFHQTYTKWEWLLVDDGSTDGSSEFARSLALENPGRVKYLCHDGNANLGQSASRNLGIAHARGEYMAFLDIDDIYLPEKIEVQTAILDAQPHIAIVYGPLYFWYEWPGNTYKPYREFVCPLGDVHDTIVLPPSAVLRQIEKADGLPGTCSVIVRSAAVREVGGFEAEFRGMYEDEMFFAKLFLQYPAYLMSKHLDLYRQHGESFSALAIRSGEYIMGPGVPSPSRMVFLNWLLSYCEGKGHEEAAEALRHHIARQLGNK